MEDLAFFVQENPIVGRCLVASRNLTQGELILKEMPLGKLIVSVKTILRIGR